MKIHNLKIERLKELLSYDSNSGLFIWNIKRKRANKGDIAGNVEPNGYVRISIDGQRYQAHQLAWLYIYGSYPLKGYMIDHIDRCKKNNSINNLRLVTNQINQRNAKDNVNNTSGYKGVVFNKSINKWQVNMRIRGKRHYFGNYKNLNDAIAKRKELENKTGGWL